MTSGVGRWAVDLCLGDRGGVVGGVLSGERGGRGGVSDMELTLKLSVSSVASDVYNFFVSLVGFP